MCNSFKREFLFTAGSFPADKDTVFITSSNLYTAGSSFGFVTEKNRALLPTLQIPELNSGFEPWYWDIGKELTHISDTESGCMVTEEELMPLTFKADVPSQGNYNVTVTITGGNQGVSGCMIFSGRRRLMERNISLKAGESYTGVFTVNVCDIIPRGKEEAFEDKSVDITVLGAHAVLSSLLIEEVSVPTLYIAGDSTVTDQTGVYPYDPGCCYGAWGQMLSAFLFPGIAVSNHAHSGLTTESFRSEGHYAIITDYIKPGDYFFIQFAHNDQKLPHLAADGGYAENLRTYIGEIRRRGAIPVIITPLARNTWKADGSYNDLLKDYADICHRVGEDEHVLVVDLHKDSMNFILSEGLEASKRFFYPKDYTHSNDYGAYLMAGYIANTLKELCIPILSDYIKETWTDFVPPEIVTLPAPPTGFEGPLQSSLPALSELERPDEPITRVEALDYIIKAVKFVPVNVYNDRYTDVVGHEWYAGIVEAAFQNELVDAALTKNNTFQPLAPVKESELISFLINAYKSRRDCSVDMQSDSDHASFASKIGLLPKDYSPSHIVSRRTAWEWIKKIEAMI